MNRKTILNAIERKLITKVDEINGTDNEDRIYESITDLWNFELLEQASKESSWYKSASQYWDDAANCPLSDDGVLGGFGKITDIDVRDSNIFLDKLHELRPSLHYGRVADCGAGIGRVSKHLLLSRFEHVDLIEQSERLLSASVEYIGSPDCIRTTRITLGLQDFNPLPNTYDVIWIQWVIGHLTDEDFILFFQRCSVGLKPNGVIVLKDNVATSWTFVVDRDDRSVARCREYIHTLFEFADVQILYEMQQRDMPEELYPVYMTALIPKTTTT